MQKLIRELGSCKFPFQHNPWFGQSAIRLLVSTAGRAVELRCAHGRPTVFPLHMGCELSLIAADLVAGLVTQSEPVPLWQLSLSADVESYISGQSIAAPSTTARSNPEAVNGHQRPRSNPDALASSRSPIGCKVC